VTNEIDAAMNPVEPAQSNPTIDRSVADASQP
jgi:hypothetical protein